jgi:hypothetical protein
MSLLSLSSPLLSHATHVSPKEQLRRDRREEQGDSEDKEEEHTGELTTAIISSARHIPSHASTAVADNYRLIFA